ncbi:hypothetical protein H257_04296 [Aphanomyces astaci]|uniref:Uncharacterized protein n=1 Tax=Aphanomyces astaci TaxID=112090 RepID=W4GX77_APHAT|nr:hypothetical protein H257_04296 [Aphanomyces astaci]ETV83599.1 hypothetical protein H257_04296 [Aphanomyces astaci]|eukprot:XP_009827029.1 hypothetical protein H257_04296 [Aphanomyces astaci]
MQQPPPDQSPTTSTPTWTQLSQMSLPMTEPGDEGIDSDSETDQGCDAGPERQLQPGDLLGDAIAFTERIQAWGRLVILRFADMVGILYRATLYCNWNTPADKSNKSVKTP